MQVLVTGGAGFVGSNLARALAGEGHRVRVLDDFSTGTTANLDGIDGVDVHEGSVADAETVGTAVDGAELVFHQAARPSVARSVADPEATHAVNATGTLQVLVAARDAGVRRVVYASSSSVYGDSAVPAKQEDQPTAPLSPYAVAKLAGEHYCRAFTAVYGLETVSLRYFNIYGPGQDAESGYAAVVPRFVTAALDGSRPVIDGDGSQTRDFTFVGDAVQANLRAAAAPGAVAGEVFNVACGRATSVLDLWELVCGITGAELEPAHGPGRVGDVRASRADISKARRGLGYEPQWDLAAGLRATVDWFAAPAAPDPAAEARR